MKKFTRIVYMTFLTKFTYMKAFWFNIAGTAASIFVYYFLWKVVFYSVDNLEGYTMAQMITYVILSRMLASQFGGGINIELSQWIYDGTIGVELLRPVSLFYTLLGKRVGEFCFFVLFKGIPISILCLIVLGGCTPAGIENFLLFVVCVCISIVIMFFFEFMVGLCSFYTYTCYGLAFAKNALLSILSGGVVPLFLFPESFAHMLDVMPFAGMVSVPVNVYLGKYGMEQAFRYMGIQVFWVVVLAMLAQLFYGHVIKRVVVQGG